jgi:UDP-N-acetylmuramoylalanine--D-glutamate ligase
MFDVKKKYGILGLARSGIAAAYKIKSLGGIAFLSDLKPENEISDSHKLRQDFECEFGIHSEKLLDCDEWIVSPGIPLTAPIIKMGKTYDVRMISELEFGFQIKAPDSKIIAITGSNGKSTTASLIAHILQKSGKKCILAGNIGDAFCGFPIEKPGLEYIVLEVSSFQLDLIDSFKPDIALLLNITPDHLNRYNSFEDYALSKFNIFMNQGREQFAILNMDDMVISSFEHKIKSVRKYFSLETLDSLKVKPDTWVKNSDIYYGNGTRHFSSREMMIKGPHNLANAMASILACELAGLSPEQIEEGLKSFRALNHRLQFIREINGVSFYNDSKATNTDSVKYALLSFEKPIRIIMGGSDKGEDFSVLTDLLKEKAKKVYITGATSAQMMQAWFGKVPITAIEDFEASIRSAFLESESGDIIVLSPACASYDKFRNYEHRGETFISIVNALAGENEEKQQ